MYVLKQALLYRIKFLELGLKHGAPRIVQCGDNCNGTQTTIFGTRFGGTNISYLSCESLAALKILSKSVAIIERSDAKRVLLHNLRALTLPLKLIYFIENC